MNDNDKVYTDINVNIEYFRERLGDTSDLIINDGEIGGVKVYFIALDGMYNNILTLQGVIKPLLECNYFFTDVNELKEKIRLNIPTECDMKETDELQNCIDGVIDGCMLCFIDKCNSAFLFSVQGYNKKGIDEAQTEVQELGSKESFTDFYKDNITLIRRRIKSPYIRFENTVAGKTSKTKICICYHAQRTDKKILESVREKLKNAELDVVPGSGAIRPFLDVKGLSLFTAVGMTERPDVTASKLAEGRVCVIVDGSPFVLFVPYLFAENFHSLDDYLNRPYYSVFIRILKVICFILSVLLPGLYVAVGTFHQEIFPSDVIYQIAYAQSKTPFPLAVEVLVIHFIYEIVREAGLRMPAVVGHAVNIVGALVIGDAAVTAGLIAAPTLIIVALTAVASSVVPSLYHPVAILRFVFIIIGGTMGLYGVMMCFGAVIADICALNGYGVPYSAPFSPFDKKSQGDNIMFSGWKKIGKRSMIINKLRGSGVVNDKR